MKYTQEQIIRAANKAATAFQLWNTSNQGATEEETLSLSVKKDQAFIRLLDKLDVHPSRFKSWKETDKYP